MRRTVIEKIRREKTCAQRRVRKEEIGRGEKKMIPTLLIV
jgi:hypothetical protein